MGRERYVDQCSRTSFKLRLSRSFISKQSSFNANKLGNITTASHINKQTRCNLAVHIIKQMTLETLN